jgi:3-oxoisoapionate decarboxylase
MNRRHFLHTTALATAASSLPAQTPATKTLVGLDHFAVRAAGMKAPALIDYAAASKVDILFISELGPVESEEEGYLKGLKAKADAAGIKLYTGGMSICPTSNTWKPEQGTPEAYLERLIRIAKLCGSPLARCVLGNAKDRTTDGGIEKHIEQCVKALKAVKSRCEAEGIKIAIENHAGDMQSQELRALIEAAGKGHVGANIDPGNAVWALEDPMHNLEVLGDLIICSSVRDSMVWASDEGATVQWTAVGEGCIDWPAYAKRFRELAPNAPLNIETISGFAKPFAYKKEEFWKPYGGQPTASFEGWLALTKKSKAIEPFKAPNKEEEAKYQKAEFERSVTNLRAAIG